MMEPAAKSGMSAIVGARQSAVVTADELGAVRAAIESVKGSNNANHPVVCRAIGRAHSAHQGELTAVLSELQRTNSALDTVAAALTAIVARSNERKVEAQIWWRQPEFSFGVSAIVMLMAMVALRLAH